jgi:subtilisin family serine protease
MRKKRLFLFMSVIVTLVITSVAPVAAQGSASINGAAPATGIPGKYIVTFKDGVDASRAANDMARAHGLSIDHVYSHALNGFAATIPDVRLDAVKGDVRVEAVVQDQVVSISHCAPNHPQHCETPTPPPGGGTQTVPTGILRINGDLSSTISGNGSGSVNVDVAVIDTGIDLTHPDLNVVGGINCSTGASFKDGHGHGSHVAGTIGALDNDFGVVGVAPGARLWAVRVLNNAGSGSWSSIICGVDWVTANAATIDVANMSLGGTGSEDGCNDNGLQEAICNSVNAGVTYVVAAGNESDNAANHVPAAYDQVITVSALADFNGEPGGGAASTCRSDEDDTLANFSNFGSDVDLIAPGVCILSTWKGGGYNTISGTSMASPHVAGAAALYKANNPGASPAQVKTALQNAGNLNWNDVDDPDNIKEVLLDVDGF